VEEAASEAESDVMRFLRFFLVSVYFSFFLDYFFVAWSQFLLLFRFLLLWVLSGGINVPTKLLYINLIILTPFLCCQQLNNRRSFPDPHGKSSLSLSILMCVCVRFQGKTWMLG
jgi:hypothetical protein